MPTQVTTDGAQVPGIITDIGGAQLECERPFQAGDHLSVQVFFDLEQVHLKSSFEAEARVSHPLESAQPDPGSVLQRYGLEFAEITLGLRIMLQNFVYHQLLQDHRQLI